MYIVSNRPTSARLTQILSTFYSWATPRNWTPWPRCTAARTARNRCWSDPWNPTWATANRLPDFVASSKQCWQWNARKSRPHSTTVYPIHGCRPSRTVGCVSSTNRCRGTAGTPPLTLWALVDTTPMHCWRPTISQRRPNPRTPSPGWLSGQREPRARSITCWTRWASRGVIVFTIYERKYYDPEI